VSSVITMREMFANARAFNQNLNPWKVSQVNDCYRFAYIALGWSLPKPTFTLCNPN